MVTKKWKISKEQVQLLNPKPISNLNRAELVEIVRQQQERIKHLERAQSLGWGKWKFDN